MRPKKILIPATLVTQRCIRIFFADYDAEVRFQPFEEMEVDLPLPDSTFLPSHEKVLRILKQTRAERTNVKYPLDLYGPVIRSKLSSCEEAICAYQLVEVTKIIDDRKKFGHKNTETEVTSKFLDKKIYIFGTRITKSQLKPLVKWVRTQMCLGPNERASSEEFDARGVSANTGSGAKGAFKKGNRSVIKLGPATFVPWNPSTMELRPLTEK